MIFPDYSVESRKCPICDNRLSTAHFAVCSAYSCHWQTFKINGGTIPHYEFCRYKDNSVFIQYIIEPLYIMTDQKSTTIYWIEKVAWSGYSKREIATKPTSMFLTDDTKDEVKRKLKMYLLFS